MKLHRFQGRNYYITLAPPPFIHSVELKVKEQDTVVMMMKVMKVLMMMIVACGRYPNFGASCQMSAYKWWTGLVLDTFDALGVKDRAVMSEVAKDLYYYYSTGTAWQLLPGATEALQQLQQFDVKLGVISNYDHRLYKVLTDMGLRQYFDFVLPSYLVGAEKPDPEIFHRALRDAVATPAEAVHFGDDIEKDFIGARNVGMSAYLLRASGVNYDFLDENLVVPTVGDFVKAITPRLRYREDAAT